MRQILCRYKQNDDIKVLNLIVERAPVIDYSLICQMGGGLQVLNGNPYNRKCDVYSFGICLWEIYCCDMPYPDLSFSEITSAVVRQVYLLPVLIICHT